MAFRDEDGNVTSRLNFGADTITIDTDNFYLDKNKIEIHTSNFTIDEKGDVDVTGEIHATKLYIGGDTAYNLNDLKGEKGDDGKDGRDGVDYFWGVVFYV